MSLNLPSPASPGPVQFVETDQHKFKFTNIDLRKSQTLGSGSYGAVCIAKCDELLCAAKLLFPALFDMEEGSSPRPVSPRLRNPHRVPIRRFEQECRFLSQIKHPNIVQYLGTYRDPDSRALVLLMELMDESLTNFLARLSIPVPYYLQVGFTHDVAVALAYLHSNNIIHRDLSSNNVLLLNGYRAKVSDFGMSTLATSPSGQSQTVCPGTPAYMPPEALDEPPRYSETLDSFSFGVLVIQILTREFPNPTDRFTRIEVQDPRQPNLLTEAKFSVAETVRRKEHIDMIDPGEPMLHIALDCLQNSDHERPSARDLCLSLEALKTSRQYTESYKERLDIEQVEIKMREIRRECQELHKQHMEDMEEKLEDAEQEIQSMNQILTIRTNLLNKLQRDLSSMEKYKAELQQKEHALNEMTEQNERLQQQVDLQDHTVHDLQSVIHRHEQYDDELRTQLARESERCGLLLQKLSLAGQSHSSNESTDGKGTTVQHPIDVADKVSELRRELSSKTSLIQSLQRQLELLEREKDDEEQRKLHTQRSICLGLRRGPNAPSKVYGGSATSIGSKAYFRPNDSSEIYEFCTETGEWNQLLSCASRSSTLVVIENTLTIIGGSCLSLEFNKWKPVHSPMHCGRYNSTAIKCGGYLVVAGGVGTDGRCLMSVEVLNLSTRHWVTCSDLPYPLYSASGVAINDNLYLLGGLTKPSVGSLCSVFTCNLKALINSRVSSVHHSKPSRSVWQKLADLPYPGATCVGANGHLFAVGGMDRHRALNSIQTYNFYTNSWESLSRLKEARSDCIVSVITASSCSKLVIVGGYTDNGLSNSVEIADVYV